MFEFDIGREIVLFIRQYPILWLPAALLSWLFVIRPLLHYYFSDDPNDVRFSLYTEDINGHVVVPADDYVFTQEMYESFYERTQQAWLNGELGDFEPQAHEVGADLGAIKKHLSKHDEALLFAFKDQAPEEDEFLVGVFDGGEKLSFLVTNKYFYFFSLDYGLMANKYETGKVAISAIERVKPSKGVLWHNVTLTLKSGKQLLVEEIYDDYPIRYLVYRLEH